ncbi:MAG: aminoacyl-tRNA hydrolase [Anaerolineae bacterium]
MATDTYLIVGLGNPGPQYAKTRHNIGWMVVERLAEQHRLSFDRLQFKARVAAGTMRDQRVVLAKPLTYMNLSGEAVGPLMRFYKIPLERLLVVYDEIDIPFNTLRLRADGGAGGHRGMRSIIQTLGSQDFSRLRVGVGRPPSGWEAADHVLAPWTKDEVPLVSALVERAALAAETWLTEGILSAMNRFNANV